MGTSKRTARAADAELDLAFAAGDRRRVVALLMARHGDQLFRYAVAMTRDRIIAEEVRQQVFTEAYRDLHRVTEAGALPKWLFGIAHNRCVDAVKAEKRWAHRYKNGSSGDADLIDEESATTAERALEREQLARILRKCLAKLAPAARDAVVLKYAQELSYDEVAEITGDRAGTLQRRVSRAFPLLRKCVNATLHGESR